MLCNPTKDLKTKILKCSVLNVVFVGCLKNTGIISDSISKVFQFQIMI